MLYRLAVDTGKFEVIKDSVGSLTDDRRLQAMFIAFSFGAFIEGAAGFGAPVAVSGAMLAGLGFNPFYAAGICLLANTAPVAFGSIGIPVTTLAAVTGLPVMPLSAMVGRLCAMISMIIPGYLIVVMAGWARALEVLPAIIACGLSFAGMQFFVSNYHGPRADRHPQLAHLHHRDGGGAQAVEAGEHHAARGRQADQHGGQEAHRPARSSWPGCPYLLLVVFVLAWGEPSIKLAIDTWTNGVMPSFLPKAPTGLNGLIVPGLHNVDHAHAAGDAGAGALRRRVHAQLAERVGHGVLPGHHRHGAGAARVARQVRRHLRRHLQAARRSRWRPSPRCSAWPT